MVLRSSQQWLQPAAFLSWWGTHERRWGGFWSWNSNETQMNPTPCGGRTTATPGYPHCMAGTGSYWGSLPRCLANHSIAQQRWPWTLEQDASDRYHLAIRSCSSAKRKSAGSMGLNYIVAIVTCRQQCLFPFQLSTMYINYCSLLPLWQQVHRQSRN